LPAGLLNDADDFQHREIGQHGVLFAPFSLQPSAFCLHLFPSSSTTLISAAVSPRAAP
jgi:hypothetical protein